MELNSLVEEGVLLVAVSVGSQLDSVVGLAEGDDLGESGDFKGLGGLERSHSPPLVVVSVGLEKISGGPSVSCVQIPVLTVSFLREVSESISAWLSINGLNDEVLVAIVIVSVPVVNGARAIFAGRKERPSASGQVLDGVGGFLSGNSSELELGRLLVRSSEELEVVLAVPVLGDESLAIELSERSDEVDSSEVSLDRLVGLVGLGLEPLVVVHLAVPEVDSIPSVSRRHVDSIATSSTNSKSISVSFPSYLFELPLLFARFVILSPEIYIGLSTGTTY